MSNADIDEMVVADPPVAPDGFDQPGPGEDRTWVRLVSPGV
jgi:hypothetical protein